MDERINEMHTIIPGEIVSFNASECVATVSPKGIFRKPDGTSISYPLIYNVPVFIHQGAGQRSVIAFPITQGDGCLLLFAEQTAEADMHFDLNSAIALVGEFAKPHSLVKEASERDAMIIASGNVKITVLSDGTAEITGNVKISGSILVDGDITAAGNITGAGISLNTHTHVAPYEGGSTSGPSSG